jgi:outer membrane protein
MNRLLPSVIMLPLAAAVALSVVPAAGQTSAERVYSLDQVVAEALAYHPRLRARSAEESAADARVDETRTGELPSAGVSAQLNRSTGNTPPGAFYPTTGFPPISGAPRGRTLDEGSWQTGASLWATWDVLSVARQAAALDVALAARAEATAAIDAQRLDVAYRAADAFLLLLEAQEAVRAAKAGVDRATVLVTMTKPLVDQSLRPGVDVARAEAELANAQTLVARAEQASEVRRAQLAEAMGDATLRVLPSPGPLLRPADDAPILATTPPTSHPELLVSRAAAERASQVQKAVGVEYLPRLDLFAALWIRGSGIYDSPASGLVPDIPNWAAGAALTWSVLDIPAIRARARAASARSAAAAARQDETYLALSGQIVSANAMVAGALRVERQAQPALASARAANEQAVARYKAGLSPLVDVADAQRVLAQADQDDAVSRLEVRRAQLLLARAAGDLGPFLAQARATGASGAGG